MCSTGSGRFFELSRKFARLILCALPLAGGLLGTAPSAEAPVAILGKLSGDGLTIAGFGTNPQGQTEAWVVNLPG